MHQAKGLTAEVVFVVAAEEEYVPGKMTLMRKKIIICFFDSRKALFIYYIL